MPRWIALIALLIGATSAEAQPLPRIASFGLCADQMAMMLAAPDQIASVSDQAAGPLSFYADRARAFPANRGSAEEIIASGVKVLLVSDVVNKRSADALASFGIKVVNVPFASSWKEVDDMTRTIAKAIGREAKGETVIADMHRRLARVQPKETRSAWPTVVYYRSDGGGAGKGTFVDISLEAAGFRNLQGDWGPPLWNGVPVEQVVRHPPDLFAVSYFDTSTNSTAILRRNPVLWGRARERPVLNVHGKYWNCGSPLLVDAVEQLAAERIQLLRGKRSGR